MKERAFGVIVPSSNRVVERVTERIIAHFSDLAACYARIPLFGAGSGQPADGYDVGSLKEAIRLISHAQIELICWNGTKGAGIGFTPDRDFCAAVKARTGLPMVSTALATLDVLKLLGARRIAILSPLPTEQVAKMGANFDKQGFETVGVRGLGITDNFACSEIPADKIIEEARALYAISKPEAMLIFNTNFRGLAAMAPLEAKLGIPVIDATSTGVWAAITAMGIDPAPAAALGRLFTVSPK